MPTAGSSVLPIFGENLDALCALRSSSARVAQELEINRVQMRRFLNGESFPKPNQLKRICDYFGVDARILTERLTARQIEHVASFGRLPRISDGNLAAKEAIDYMGDFDPFFLPSHELADGMYLFVSPSQLQRGMIAQVHMQIETLHRARVVRTVLPNRYSGLATGPGKAARRSRRIVRGMVLRHGEGYSLQFINSAPRRFAAMIYLSPARSAEPGVFEGIHLIGQGERQGIPRVTRCLISRVEPTPRNLVAAAHLPEYVPLSEMPADVREALTRPIE